MGLPPGNSKFSNDANPVTTFFWQFPNITATHNGVTATAGISSVAGGGTGLATLPAHNILIGNGTSTLNSLAPGTAGNVAISNGTDWTSALLSGSSSFAIYASSQVTTQSSSISSGTFTTFSNSPAFTFSPSISGTYKVYCAIPLEPSGSGAYAVGRIFNTSGSATLLYESQCIVGTTNGSPLDSALAQSVYTLTAGNTYQFDIQGYVITGGTITCNGANANFYMFAEGVGLISSTTLLNVQTITANTNALQGVTYDANTSGGAFTLTLPVPTSGIAINVKDSTGSFGTNQLTVAPHASEMIEGLAASKVLYTNWGSWTFYANGTNWFMR